MVAKKGIKIKKKGQDYKVEFETNSFTSCRRFATTSSLTCNPFFYYVGGLLK